MPPSRVRNFSTSVLGRFDWLHRGVSWDVSYTILTPDHSKQFRGTVVMFPSTTLLSSREEWRSCGEYLSDLGYRIFLFDWPGWHKRNVPLNWSMEDDVRDQKLVSAFADYAYTALLHSYSENGDTSIHVVAAGGNSAIHASRAIRELRNEGRLFHSLTCFTPAWRFYLPRTVPEGYPRKLQLRKAVASWFLLNGFIRSSLAFRLYRSKFTISKLTRRLYEEKIQRNPDLLDSKREVIMRDRPLSLDAAMILGKFDSVSSTPDLLKELLDIKTSYGNTEHEDSDDDDGLLNIRVPSLPANVEERDADQAALNVCIVFPQDVVKKDREELRVIREWAEHHRVRTEEMPGKILCHEESPAISATILDGFFGELDLMHKASHNISS